MEPASLYFDNENAHPLTLTICMTRGKRTLRDNLSKTFGSFEYVVVDVDGECHRYNADDVISALEKFEV